MFDFEFVEDIGCVEFGVVVELVGDDFYGFGEVFDDGLLFVGYVVIGELVEVGGYFYFCGIIIVNNSFVVDGVFDNYEGVVERVFNFGDELFSIILEDKSVGFGGGVVFKEVEVFVIDLFFVEGFVCVEMFGVDVGVGVLDSGVGGLNNMFYIIGGYMISVEDVVISEVLGS